LEGFFGAGMAFHGVGLRVCEAVEGAGCFAEGEDAEEHFSSCYAELDIRKDLLQ